MCFVCFFGKSFIMVILCMVKCILIVWRNVISFKIINCVLFLLLLRLLLFKCIMRNFGLWCWIVVKNDFKCWGFVIVLLLSLKNWIGGSLYILNSFVEVFLFFKYDENFFMCEFFINNVVIVLVMWFVKCK